MQIDYEKIAKYSKAGPRYTSYPTAVEFSPKFDRLAYERALARSADSKNPYSIYVHLPFCEKACYFCACNVIYTKSDAKKKRYLDYLQKELAILKGFISQNKHVSQLHFGGGTPTYYGASELERVILMIKDVFLGFDSESEVSCEIDPRFFTKDQMVVLKSGGFNRLSFGLQDFDITVQRAINRIQPYDLVKNAVDIARNAGIESINFDLIYGLPHQDLNTFKKTLDLTLSLEPDRLAIFNYAHVPWVKSTMAMIDEKALPDSKAKLEISKFIREFLQSKGFLPIGMDHYAKSSDALYSASLNGTLRRNFQGYSTKAFSQTIGVGITSIGEGEDYYVQNHKDLHEYESALDAELLPIERGILLSEEDILRKYVIMELMNNARLDFREIESQFGVKFKEHFERELGELRIFVEDGVLEILESSIKVSETGKFLIRNIAMTFDTHSKNIPPQRLKFSKTI